MITNESTHNLRWLEPGKTYVCVRPLVVEANEQGTPKLHEAHTYRFESFSGDPLCDTRQYLFTDLENDRAYGVELTHELLTPAWAEYLEPV